MVGILIGRTICRRGSIIQIRQLFSSSVGNSGVAPNFSFGVIADVQHANIDDAYRSRPPVKRFYRHALDKMKVAVQTWNENKVDFAIQLGDIIDGFSKEHRHRDKDFENLLNIVKEFKSTGLAVRKMGDVYVPIGNGSHDDMSPYMCHLWGNHDFYNFSRSDLWKSELNSYVIPNSCENKMVELSSDYYFSFSHKGFRFVCLDGYDISTISHSETSKSHKIARKTLLNHNKNKVLEKPDWDHPRYVSWNGAIGKRQLNWLQNELVKATNNMEKVIILTHIPLHVKASDVTCLVWNCEEVLDVINEFECVVLCLAGHYHDGRYFYDKESKIHHLTFPGVIERDPATNAYAIIEVFDDCLKVNGYGVVKSHRLLF